MKPAPRVRHLAAMVILAAVAAVQTSLACLDSRLSPAQVRTMTARFSHRTPDALCADPTFGAGGIRATGNPFQRLLARAVLTDESHLAPHVALGLVAGVLALTYLCGMYFLLLRQCHLWSLAVFVAVCSLRVVDTLGNAFWGVGALATATSEGLFVAAAPWLVLALLRTADRRQMVLVFGVIGLLGNGYVPGAVAMLVVALVAYLCSRGVTWRRAGLAGLCGALALVGLAPALWHQVHAAGSLPSVGAATGAREAMDALGMGNLRVGYTAMLKDLLNWALLTSVLVLPLAVTFTRAVRRHVRDQGWWLWLLGGSLCVAIPVHGLCLLAGRLQSAPPPAIAFIRAAALAMLPLYVFFAEALVALFRALPSSRRLLRAACAVLAVVWFGGSDNLRMARHACLETATMFLDEESKPQNVRRHHEEGLARDELTAMARWAREPAHTSARAVFLVAPGHAAAFRMVSRRAVAACRDDAQPVYRLVPQRLGQWRRRVLQQAPLLAGRTSDARVRTTVAEWLKAGLFRHADAWYLVRHADEPVPEGLTEVVGEHRWGGVYRLFKLPE